jgi:hypothetical protein
MMGPVVPLPSVKARCLALIDHYFARRRAIGATAPAVRDEIGAE